MNTDFIFPPDNSPRRVVRRKPAGGAAVVGIFAAGIFGAVIVAAMACFFTAKIGLYLFGVSLDGLQKRRER